MAKEKIFSPEDFDKPKATNFWQKYKAWIIGGIAVLLVGAIGLCWIFCNKTTVNSNSSAIQPLDEQVSSQIDSQSESTLQEESSASMAENENDQALQLNTPSVISETQVSESPKVEPEQVTIQQPQPRQPAETSVNVEKEALKVIRGDYGNVPERRRKLGPNYVKIQRRVNQIMREY